MGYYIRVLGTQDPDITIDELTNALIADGLAAQLLYDDATEDATKWTMLDIVNKKGQPIAQLERNPVTGGELGMEELAEFKDSIPAYKPVSAVQWLTAFLESVQVIYAFQLLTAAFEDSNFEIISCIKTNIWNKVGGILQADDEGFTNEDGYHILWQFADNVTGEWSCAIEDTSGHWQRFVMDLGDVVQRQEFQSGKVPGKAKLL